MDFEPVPLDENIVNTLLRGKTLQTKVKKVSLFEQSSFNLVFLMYLLAISCNCTQLNIFCSNLVLGFRYSDHPCFHQLNLHGYSAGKKPTYR